jgi:hypothetical protein
MEKTSRAKKMTQLSPNLVFLTTVESSSVSARTKLSIFDRPWLSFLCLFSQQVKVDMVQHMEIVSQQNCQSGAQ